MNVTGNVVGGRSQGKLPVVATRAGRRRDANGALQAVDSLGEIPIVLDSSMEIALLSREPGFKEQLAGLVFDKHLVEQFQEKLSHIFDSISRDVDKNNRRMALTAPLYSQSQGSFKQKIHSIAFRYLTRINHEITKSAQQESVNIVLNKACRVYDAIDQSYAVTTQELTTLGIANEDMLNTFSSTQTLMENDVIETAAHILDDDFTKDAVKDKTRMDVVKIKQHYQLDEHRFFTKVVQYFTKERAQQQTSNAFYKTKGLKHIAEIQMQPLEGAGITLCLLNEFDQPLVENFFAEKYSLNHVWSVQKHRHVKILAGLRGELTPDETAAVVTLLEKFLVIEDLYFNHRVKYAYSNALDNGYDHQEIIAFAFDPHRKVHKRNMHIYQSIAESDDVEIKYDENLHQIDLFTEKLAELMTLSEQFGIKQSDDFVEQMLVSLASFDKRKDYDYYQSPLSDQVVLSKLLGAIRTLVL